MRSLLLALLATIAGLVMLVGGVYGVISDLSEDDDDDSPAATTTTLPAFPSVPTTRAPGAPDPCLQVTARDLRLGLIENIDLQPAGRERGSAEVRPTCAGKTVSLTFQLKGMRTGDKPNSYFVWLKNRRKAKQIGSLIGQKGTAFGSATIGADIDTMDFEEIVITRVPFGKGEERPRRIVFRGSL